MLLVATFHTPHVHNIGFLRTQGDRLDPRVIEAWPRAARTDRARFEKLEAAYVRARYLASYSVAADELEWLTQRVAALSAAVQAMCA